MIYPRAARGIDRGGDAPEVLPRTRVAQSPVRRQRMSRRDGFLIPASRHPNGQTTIRTTSNNQRPTWLDLAHRELDHAVLNAYGRPHDLTGEQILERLLAPNLERAGKE